LGVGLGVVVVALEALGAVHVDDLADGVLGVGDAAVLVQDRGGAGLARLGVDDPDAVVGGPAERARRRVRRLLDHAGALAGAVPLDQPRAEAAQELGLVLGGRLRAEPVRERVVGVV